MELLLTPLRLDKTLYSILSIFFFMNENDCLLELEKKEGRPDILGATEEGPNNE